MSRISRLDRLGVRHQERLPALQEKWLAVGLSTGLADRRRAAAAVETAYRLANLHAPAHVVWFDSPLSGVLAAAWFAQAGGEIFGSGRRSRPNGSGSRQQIAELVRTQISAQVRTPVEGGVGAPVRYQVRDQVRSQIEDRVGPRVGDQAWLALRSFLSHELNRRVWVLVGAPIEAQLMAQAGLPLQHAYGQFDAAWVAVFEALRAFGLTAETKELAGLCAITENCGWWWPFENLCVLTDHPTRLELDTEGRLHSASGPAVGYSDGWSIYAWHGVQVAKAIITRPESITVRQIQREPNVERRRVLLERYGFDRYLVNGGGQPIHADESGTLYRCEWPREEPQLMVRVMNSTPEPDGSVKHYVLRVPPTITTARDAIAWTFQMSGQDYHPIIET